ncbi:cobalt-precorrin-5B (C(1))-methyltransferase CbiD [Parabacteroides distasonis]|uniref:cobalt-precorrin-5B (C(1))-methyltransferase CbiD n=1 Tax=Parabacteroides distasonis TaxID=823 RepID=UPI001898CD31|nr:cobalt-precorrin-5B (C(1))-methyltransferase CbiD [Parabacteroides distasonis]MDB8994961.1 cobalt-precorrin-5B (C(1))-methyltransferase CbiD [Parabacteroides distasonis]MDB9070807.1 cobalt-precorrin-5B (C(1))-methyltransferase CbiD [Parabacteroides distasonis]
MILILGGTTEGRVAVRVVDEAAATYYYSTKGTLQSIECAHGIRLTGAMNAEEMECFCRDHAIKLLIDAAHPFAQVLHQTIEKVSKCLQIPVIRYERRYPPRDEDLIWCDSYADAIHQMENKGIQRLLALSGVNTLAPLRPYWRSHTTWFRILEREESLSLAEKQGFPQERLVFYREGEDELKLLEQLHPDAILTKESGFSGYFTDKVNAARQFGIPVFVVKRPALPETFYRVYGEDGLRKQIERLLPEFFPLKSGYTTGACATAAAKAALLALLSRKEQTESQITLPSGEQITLSVAYTEWARCSATCTVIKESGDDPDVTNHSRIRVTVQLSPEASGCDDTERVIFQAGEGVGTVTLPGLGLKVGGPAINATPRKMIRQELIPLLPSPDSVAIVTVSVPGGEELAKRTFNPKLGIIGGISIIGTSGIVRPFSSDAFIASIRKEASVAKAIGCETLVINSGAKSERYLRSLYASLPPQSFVHYGNFIGETLKIAADLGFKQVILGIMIGKAVKLAEGFLDTHSKKVIMNKGFLQDVAKEAKCEEATVDAINRITLARELWELLAEKEQNRFFPLLLQKCKSYCAPILPDGELTLLLISEEGKVLYQS